MIKVQILILSFLLNRVRCPDCSYFGVPGICCENGGFGDSCNNGCLTTKCDGSTQGVSCDQSSDCSGKPINCEDDWGVRLKRIDKYQEIALPQTAGQTTGSHTIESTRLFYTYKETDGKYVLKEDQCPINECELYSLKYLDTYTGYIQCNGNIWKKEPYTLDKTQAASGLRGSITVDISTLTQSTQYCIICKNFDKNRSKIYEWTWAKYVVKRCDIDCSGITHTISPIVPNDNTPLVGFISPSNSNTKEMGPRIPLFSTGNVCCPITQYELYNTDELTLMTTPLDGSQGYDSPYFDDRHLFYFDQDSSAQQKQVIDFKIRITIKGRSPQFIQVSQGVSQVYQYLVTDCQFSLLDIGAQPYLQTQTVNFKSSTETKFLIGRVSLTGSTGTHCGTKVTKIEVHQANYRNDIQNSLGTPSIYQENGEDYWAVAPADINLAQNIDFYIKVFDEKGVYQKFATDKMTLQVKNPCINNQAANNMGVAASIIVSAPVLQSFTHPTATDAVQCPLSQIEITSVASTSTAITFSDDTKICTTLSSCSQIKLNQTSVEDTVTVEFKSTFQDNEFIITTATFSIICDPSTPVQIDSSITEFEKSYVEGDVTTNIYEFQPFTCTKYPGCCKNNVYTVSKVSKDPAQIFTELALSQVSGVYTVTIPSTDLTTFEFYIHMKEQTYGYSKVSQKISAEIVFDCKKDKFSLKQELSSTDIQIKDGKARYIISKPIGSISSFTQEVKSRFQKLSPIGRCQLQKFKIDKVISATGEQVQDFSKLFEISNEGVFKILIFNKQIQNYQVFVSTFNGEIWSDSQELGYLIDVSFFLNPNKTQLPNLGPIFQEDLKKVEIDLGSQQNHEFTLPAIIDLDGDLSEISVEIEDIQSFMNFDSESKKITIDQSKSPQAGSYTVNVVLKDKKGGQNTYALEFELKIPEKPVPSAPSNINFTFNQEQKLEQKDKNDKQIIINQEKVKDCSAKISKISPLGDLTIQFDQRMQLPEVDKINSTLLELYIDPAIERYEEDFVDLSKLNFTWFAKSKDTDSISIKLNFSDPLDISRLVVQDFIVVYFLQKDHFFCPELNKPIDAHYKLLSKKIPKQLPDSDFTRSVQSNAEVGEETMRYILISTFVMSLFIRGGMKYMVMYIRSLQLILHLPLLKKIVTPSNVNMVFSIIIPIAMFDVLDQDISIQLIVKFDEKAQEDAIKDENGTIFDQMKDLGYDSHNAILILGSMGIFTILYFFKVIMSLILKPFQLPRVVRFRNWLTNNLFFQEILILILEGYIEFLIAHYLNMHLLIKNTVGDLFAILFTFSTMFLCYIFVPGAIIYVIIKDVEVLNEQNFKKRWGALYEETKPTVSGRLFTLFFILRRALFLASCFFMMDQPNFQMIFIQFLNIFMTIFQGGEKPLSYALENKIELFNEYCVSSATFSMLFFTDWNPEQEDRYSYGWFMISIIGIMLLINLLIVIIKSIKPIKMISIKSFRLTRLYFWKNSQKIRELFSSQKQMYLKETSEKDSSDKEEEEEEEKQPQMQNPNLQKSVDLKKQLSEISEMDDEDEQEQKSEVSEEQIYTPQKLKPSQLNLIKDLVRLPHSKNLMSIQEQLQIMDPKQSLYQKVEVKAKSMVRQKKVTSLSNIEQGKGKYVEQLQKLGDFHGLQEYKKAKLKYHRKIGRKK